MFKDLPEGQTHYMNDGCGEPAHNDVQVHCLSIDCPERTGGKCNAFEHMLRRWFVEKLEKEAKPYFELLKDIHKKDVQTFSGESLFTDGFWEGISFAVGFLNKNL